MATGSIHKQLTILAVETRISKKSGKPYRVAQCVVEGESVKVGELMLFREDMQVYPGTYNAEFDVTVNYEKQVGAELIALHPAVAQSGTIGASIKPVTVPKAA